MTFATGDDLGESFRVGAWQVRPADGVVEQNGRRRHLQPQQMSLLLYLTARGGKVVAKEEILERVWHGAVVEEVALPRCISELRKALGDDARQPRYIETVPRHGYRLIARVRSQRRSAGRRFPWIALAAGLGVVLSLVFVLPHLNDPRPAEDGSARDIAPVADDRPTIAVLELVNLSDAPEMGWLSTALPEMLATELARSRELAVAPSWTVARLTSEIPLAPKELSPEALRRVQGMLGTDYVVVGTFLKLAAEEEDRLRLDLTLRDCATGETVTALRETGTAAEIFDLVALAGRRLREALGASEVRGESFPVIASPQAARLYFEGLSKLRRFEATGARKLLERSLADDPRQPLAHLALAEAWSSLGYETRAKDASLRALELSSELPRQQKLWIEARQLVLAAQWDEAIEVYRALWVFAPENLAFGLELARAQNASGRPLEAIETLAEIRTRVGAGYEDATLDLVAAEAAQLHGQYDRALGFASAAAELGARHGADMVVARARHQQGLALHGLGRVDEAVASLDWAMISFAAAGDLRSEALTRLHLAGWRADQGDFEGARELLRESLTVFQAVGDRRGMADTTGRLGTLALDAGEAELGETMLEEAAVVYREIGDLIGEARAARNMAIHLATNREYQRARELFQRALEIYEGMGNGTKAAGELINLGRVLQLESRPREAAEPFARAEALLRASDSPRPLATLRYNQGHLHLQLGELEPAGAALSEAADLFRQLDNPRMLAASLNGLGGVLTMRDDLEQARTAIEEALALRTELAHSNRIVNSQVGLAVVLLEMGQHQAAEEIARVAVGEADRAKGVERVPPLRVLATILLRRDRIDEAASVIAEARRDLTSASSVSLQMLAITAARVSAGSGNFETGRAELLRVVEDAESLGAWPIRAEAELALAEVDLAAGDRKSASARLARLGAESRDRGQALILRKTRRLEDRLSAPERQPSG
ncbi:MAG: tetratricopeptide repeat protein [bacterium]|nr:tetratricopeptide repeat protein [bacterium]